MGRYFYDLDYQESMIDLTILRNQVPGIPFFEPNNSNFQAVVLTSAYKSDKGDKFGKFL